MMFNPCSPCCYKVLIIGRVFDQGQYFQYVTTDLTNLTNIFDNSNNKTLILDSTANLTAQNLTGIKLIISDLEGFNYTSNESIINDWFALPNKRLVLVNNVNWIATGTTGPIGGIAVENNTVSFKRGQYNSTIATFGSNLQLNTTGILKTGSGGTSNGNFISGHYLTDGLINCCQTSDIYLRPITPPSPNPYVELSVGSAEVLNGTPLAFYDTSNSIAVEKINNSEIILFGDVFPFLDVCNNSNSAFWINLASLDVQ